jgi:hypothetical protein
MAADELIRDIAAAAATQFAREKPEVAGSARQYDRREM